MSEAGKHVLLIDDDPDMHDVVRLILEPLGVRITCCATAPTGMETLRNDHIDLLLLDIMLAAPTEGLVLAREIKRDERLRSIPIIIISSIGESVGTAYARELGAAGLPGQSFMEKPLDPRKLQETVKQLLDAAT